MVKVILVTWFDDVAAVGARCNWWTLKVFEVPNASNHEKCEVAIANEAVF